MSYSDPILKALIDKFNTQGPAVLRNKYFIGDPVIVPLSNLPMVFLSKDSTTIAIDTNVEDVYRMPVVLDVVYSGAAELHQGSFAQAGAQALYELCEGRNSNYSLKTDSLAYVLRNNQVLDGDDHLYIDIEGADTVIEYVLSPPSRRTIFSVEAIIRTTLLSRVVRT